MKTFIKCEMCNAEISTDICVFATCKRVIDGKEYIYCCPILQKKHEVRQRRGIPSQK